MNMADTLTVSGTWRSRTVGQLYVKFSNICTDPLGRPALLRSLSDVLQLSSGRSRQLIPQTMSLETIIEKQRAFAPELAKKPLSYRLNKLAELRKALKVLGSRNW